eukprot:21361-Heterococcus_DN1.PRE.3
MAAVGCGGSMLRGGSCKTTPLSRRWFQHGPGLAALLVPKARSVSGQRTGCKARHVCEQLAATIEPSPVERVP